MPHNEMIDKIPTGTLRDGEPHPAAHDAKTWILGYVGRHDSAELFRLLESFASVGMSGNRLAECCGETLRRLLDGEPVSDRYLLGLAWTMRNMEEMAALPPEQEVSEEEAVDLIAAALNQTHRPGSLVNDFTTGLHLHDGRWVYRVLRAAGYRIVKVDAI